MNYIKTTFDSDRMRSDLLAALSAPDYTENPGWYDRRVEEQKSEEIAVIQLGRVIPSNMPYLQEILPLLPKMSHVQLFITRPNHRGGWHKDGVDRKTSLNFPIWNCEEGSSIEWTGDHVTTAVRYLSPYTTHLGVPKDTLLNINDHLVLANTTHLVRTNEWHRINNLGDPMERVVLAMRFEDNPEFDDVVSFCKDTGVVL